MNFGNLASFSALANFYPSFVIPVFAVYGSNESYVQDLTLDGKVKSFRSFETGRFYSVPLFPQSLKVVLGENGVAAYWASEFEVWVGDFDSLKGRIAELDETLLPSFVAVEAMTLVGDRNRLAKAAARASKQIRDHRASNAYSVRILSRSLYMKNLSKQQSIVAREEPKESLDKVLILLQSDLTDRRWQEVWTDSWRRFKGSDKLFGILKWKFSFGLSQISQMQCVSVLSSSVSELHQAFTLRWLQENVQSESGWSSIWLSLFRSIGQPSNSEVQRIGFVFLEERCSSASLFLISHQWCMIWMRLWRDGFDHDRLNGVAQKASRREIRHSDSFVGMVIRPIRSEFGETRWVLAYLEKWLSRPLGYRIWVNTYLELDPTLGSSTHFREAGIEWLRRLGAGMNLWFDLWKLVCTKESETLSIALAIAWLERGRKDLSSWPSVFLSTFNLMGRRSSPALINVAQLWLKSNIARSQSSRLIRAVADGDFREIDANEEK